MTKKEQLRHYIVSLIKDHKLNDNEKLGAESALSKQFGMSRTTVREVTQSLINDGLIYRINGSGLFVGKSKLIKQTHYHELTSFNDRAKQQGMTANRKVISINIEKPSEQIAQDLQLKASDYAYHIVRLMLFDEIPITLEDFFMPANMFPNLNISNIKESKYKYVESVTNRAVCESIQVLKPIIVQDKHIEQLLNLDLNQPVMHMREITYLDDGRPFEVNESIFNSKLIEINQVAKR
ncbi:GntR family transcriptional regulator [Aliivibrio fischeri]|uniref:GntR family transcriptional regulator n=1 Tax=Aliivibrio fischeri TaxID=668 RepID=UPI00084C5342|nr:GntR family transcriptional regulator [Aliivibrio fischeri]OED53039.1 hypothetical protein BEI47_18315 [Aliivibrio fischeri]